MTGRQLFAVIARRPQADAAIHSTNLSAVALWIAAELTLLAMTAVTLLQRKDHDFWLR